MAESTQSILLISIPTSFTNHLLLRLKGSRNQSTFGGLQRHYTLERDSKTDTVLLSIDAFGHVSVMIKVAGENLQQCGREVHGTLTLPLAFVVIKKNVNQAHRLECPPLYVIFYIWMFKTFGMNMAGWLTSNLVHAPRYGSNLGTGSCRIDCLRSLCIISHWNRKTWR